MSSCLREQATIASDEDNLSDSMQQLIKNLWNVIRYFNGIAFEAQHIGVSKQLVQINSGACEVECY